jgi:hypothetical protein
MLTRLTIMACMLAVSFQGHGAFAQNIAIADARSQAQPAPEELSARQLKDLAKAAKTAEDHLKIAQYYKNEADKLDAAATAYERAAVSYLQSSNAKNLTAPGTPVRYEYSAKAYREEAKLYRQRAAVQEQMANGVVASLQ